MSSTSSSAIQGRITVFVCDTCGRKGFSSLEIKPKHYWRGAPCPGPVVKCSYIFEGEER